MGVRLDKPWLGKEEALARLFGHLGVFQLGDADGSVVYIGFAGGRSQFGLRGAVSAALEECPEAQTVRYEITTAYQSRFKELMMVHIADFGAPPKHNPPINLGRLSPSGSPAH